MVPAIDTEPIRVSIGDGPSKISWLLLSQANYHRSQFLDSIFFACTGGGGGLFTSTNPEVRRVTPTANGRTRVKLVYVVLEAQYQSALTQAVKNINANRSNVCVEVVGYLLEELRDPSNYAAFTKDMEDANVFIGSLIFIEELADKVSTHGMHAFHHFVLCIH